MSSSNDNTEDLNGLIFNSHYFPEEIVAYILTYVDPPSLMLQCRLVCKKWKYLIDENIVWKMLIRYVPFNSFSKLSHSERMKLNLPWYVYYAIFSDDPFEMNLIKNNCGQEMLDYWQVAKFNARRSIGGSSFWNIEPTPVGSDPLPESDDFEGETCCFVTSYVLCEKLQLVELKEYGITSKIMDELQPTITASDWYAGRFDAGCVYQLTVCLLDENKEILHEKSDEKKKILQWQGRHWHKVEYTFSNYGKGVRFVEFMHAGKDEQYWLGHYGSKMSGAVVKVSLPKPKVTTSV